MKAIVKISVFAVTAVACMALSCPAQALSTWDTPSSALQQSAPKKAHPDERVIDTADTSLHWGKARQYQKQQRYELARQHYLLALSSCRTEETRDRLQRELQIVDLQLRTLR